MLLAYDVVVIGAGSNGLALALRLQRAGLKTLVVEQAGQVGGMARTEEPLLPGFRHNPHANYLAYGAVNPLERDFDLAACGLATVTPEAQHGLSFEDGRPPLVLYRQDGLERSVASLAAYSKRDGETYGALKAGVDALNSLMQASLYGPPSRERAARQIEAATDLYARHGGRLGAQSAAQVIDQLFESDEIRALFYQLAAETGLSVEAPGSGVGFLTFTLWLVGQWRLTLGGMQSYANALREAGRREGVEIATDAPVERIVVRGGKASAVVIAGHGQVVARRAVASSAGLATTLLGLLPATALSPRESSSAQAYAALDGPGIASLAICLSAAPDYRSAQWNPDINRCFRTVVGYPDARSTLAHLREIEAGLLPAPAAALRINSLWDPSQAPAGFHMAGGDVLMPGPGAMDAASWAAVANGFAEAFGQVWARHTRNLSADTILATRFAPPARYDRALRLREGTDQYRTEIGRLYLCGASTYPGGGVHGACGFNAFAAMAEDLRLPIAG
jgi:phytoene dehydrogenase-like protein